MIESKMPPVWFNTDYATTKELIESKIFSTEIPWTTFNGTTTHIYFGDILGALFTANDGRFALECEIRNWNSANNQRLWSNAANPVETGRLLFAQRTSTVPQNVRFEYKAGDGTTATENIESTEVLADAPSVIRVEYDGSFDVNAEDRVKFYVNQVQQTSEVDASSGNFPFNLTAFSPRELSFGAFRYPDGTVAASLLEGDTRNLKVQSWSGSAWVDELFITNVSTGVDTSGNGNDGTFVA